MEIHDSFVVNVIPPKGESLTITCGVDKQASYHAKAGPGIYKILVRLTSVDQRALDGAEVEFEVPEE